jgi:malonyl-CoA O-methyltransferase
MALNKQIITRFNRGAKTYHQAAHLQAQIAKNLSHHLIGVQADDILEIGCGTGLFTQYLLKTFPQSNVLLTDISPSMIEECRQQFRELSPTAFACVDGETLHELPSFDLIVSSMTLHWFNAFQSSVQRIQQKLKKNGRFIFAMLTDYSLHEWQNMCDYFNYPIATPAFPSLIQLKNQFPEFTFRVEEIKEIYSNAHTFLKTLKFLGATAARPEYTPLASNQLRHLIHHFDHEISITYEVVYGEYQA